MVNGSIAMQAGRCLVLPLLLSVRKLDPQNSFSFYRISAFFGHDLDNPPVFGLIATNQKYS
jgi:hypothetical protein